MEKLAETLKELWKDIQQKETKNKAFLLNRLNKILTKNESKHIKYISLSKDTLKLGVDSSCWLYHFYQKKDEILEKLKIKDLKFYIAER
jgi:hypothetical protein